MDVVDAFQSLPICTRTWLGLTFAITAAVTMDVIPVDQVVLDWDRIGNIISIGSSHDRYYERPELWRCLTSFCCCETSLKEFHALFLLFTIYTHTSQYEKNPFPAGSGSRSADTLFAMLFCATIILCSHSLPWYFFGPAYAMYPILTRNLVGAMLYIWSKRNPRAMIQLNFIPMEGRYVPFAHLGLSYFMGSRFHELLHGFVVGHFYYFLIAIAPIQLGRRILTAPLILVDLVGDQRHVMAEEVYEASEPQRGFGGANFDRATPAHVAAKLGDLAKLQALVEATTTNAGGHSRRLLLTAPDRNGWQPLHEACRGGYIDLVRYLIEEQKQYIDVRARTNGGQTPLSLSIEYHGMEHPMTELLQQSTPSNGNDESSDDASSSNEANGDDE